MVNMFIFIFPKFQKQSYMSQKHENYCFFCDTALHIAFFWEKQIAKLFKPMTVRQISTMKILIILNSWETRIHQKLKNSMAFPFGNKETRGVAVLFMLIVL